jgi:N-ethylmaleimide reductase
MAGLFEPTRLGALALENSIVMAPLTRSRSDANGVPRPFVKEYYAQRASAGLIVSEGTQPSYGGQGYARTPGCHTPEQVAAWREVTDAVHAKGAKMVLQIMHCGRIAHRLNRVIDETPAAPSAVKPAGQMWTDQKQMQDYETPRAFETSEIPALIDEFVRCSRMALEAGFDGIEVHAANGYLHNQFLASNSNVRTDAYGGSVARRIRFTVETIEAIGAAIGIDRTAIRISPGHMFNDLVDANPIETHVALLDALDTTGMAYVHLMKADAFAPQLNNGGDPEEMLKIVRAHTKGALIAAGGYTRQSGEAALQSGLLQAVVFGRPFIGNPDLVRRLREGLLLVEPKQDAFYTPGPEGYSDYPAYAG